MCYDIDGFISALQHIVKFHSIPVCGFVSWMIWTGIACYHYIFTKSVALAL